MFRKRFGEALTLGLTSVAVVAGIVVANSLVSTPAVGQSTNPYHNPYHSTNPYHNPYHGGGSGGSTTLPVSSTAFKCNTRGYDVKSQWVTNGQIGIYDFYGDEVPNSAYGCTNAGITMNLTNSTTTLSSVSYSLNSSADCNDAIGPDVFINFNLPGGGTGTNRVVCSSNYIVGTDSNGYTIYSIPASAFEIGYPANISNPTSPAIDTPYAAGDTLNNVALVFFPGNSTQGTVKVTNYGLNGIVTVPAFGLTTGCQNFVQVELDNNGFSCLSNNCQ